MPCLLTRLQDNISFILAILRYVNTNNGCHVHHIIEPPFEHNPACIGLMLRLRLQMGLKLTH